MDASQIAVIVASVVPSLVLLWVTRGIQRSDAMQKQLDSVDRRVVAVEASSEARVETIKRLQLHIERLESKIDLLISKLMERPSA